MTSSILVEHAEERYVMFVSFQQRKIESYREEQKNGKDLNSDQLAAVAKYEEVQQTLEFSRDLCKQYNGIAIDAAKQLKKQVRKEALEKAQQEVTKVKEILMVQVSSCVTYVESISVQHDKYENLC